MAAPMDCLCFAKFVLLFAFCAIITNATDEFHEELFIKPLESGHVYNHFQFTTNWDVDLEDVSQFNHYHLFPKSLGEVLTKYRVQELHLTQTQGRWSHDKWGYPMEDNPPGAQLWVWFQPGTQNIDSSWTELINVLSGMFCASLNFMDSKNTVVPKLSFRPQGVTTEQFDRRLGNNVRYASLASELVCTENLTPWKKLLPCGARTGLSTLFNAAKLYDASYSTLGIHYRPLCKFSSCNETSVELSQTLGVVFEPPVGNNGMQDWSFKKHFNKLLSTSCPLASTSKIYVDITSNRTEGYSFTLTPEPMNTIEIKRGTQKIRTATYDIPVFLASSKALSLAAKYNRAVPYSRIPPPLLHAHRFQTGYGQEKGGLSTLIYNHHPRKLVTVSFMEVIPWYLRPFLHTLKVEAFGGEPDYAGQNGTTIKPLHLHFVPGKDRQRPHLLELVLTLPAESITRVSWEFERALLKWTEYPPDANHGFYVSSAVISSVLPTSRNYTAAPQHSSRISSIFTDTSTSFFVRVHTESLLVTLPTPDFSMPYNVICLACTVVAIAFGSIHNLTTRRFVVLDPAQKRGILSKIKAKLFRKKAADVAEEKSQQQQEEEEVEVEEEENSQEDERKEDDGQKEEVQERRSETAKTDASNNECATKPVKRKKKGNAKSQ